MSEARLAWAMRFREGYVPTPEDPDGMREWYEMWVRHGGRPKPPDVWAVVELMGHVKHAGVLTEEEKFGGKLGRIDVPDGERFVTHYFGSASVYRVTIVDEAAARAVASHNEPRPVQAWEMPKALPAGPPVIDDDAASPADADEYDYPY